MYLQMFETIPENKIHTETSYKCFPKNAYLNACSVGVVLGNK